MEKIAELQSENNKIIEQFNNQNIIITNLESKVTCLEEELTSFKKEKSIYVKQEQHINGFLDKVKTVSQCTEKMKTRYDKLKIIKQKHEGSILKKRNVNSEEKLYNDNPMCSKNTNSDFLNNESYSENILENSKNPNTIVKTEIEDEIGNNTDESLESDSVDEETNHLRINNGKKSHKCHICSKCFKYTSYLKRHNRIHTGDKPFKCSICPRGFSQSGSLTMHLRFHTGEKPFKCSICPRKFSKSGNLKRHLFNFHSG